MITGRAIENGNSWRITDNTMPQKLAAMIISLDAEPMMVGDADDPIVWVIVMEVRRQQIALVAARGGLVFIPPLVLDEMDPNQEGL